VHAYSIFSREKYPEKIKEEKIEWEIRMM